MSTFIKKSYNPPRLTEYGEVGALTLGGGGTLPDLNTSYVLVNNNCPTETFVDSLGVIWSRAACVNTFS